MIRRARSIAVGLAVAALAAACGDVVRLGGANLPPNSGDGGPTDDAATVDASSDAADASDGPDACAHGGCQPVSLAANLGAPRWLALDATRVYWTEANAVRSVAKDGTGLATITTSSASYGAIAVDATDVYWSVQTSVAPIRIAVETTPRASAPNVTTLTHLAGTFAPAGVALDAANVYFAIGTEVIGAPKGSADAPPTDVMGGLSVAGGVASDGVTLFAADPNGVFTLPSSLAGGGVGGVRLPGSTTGALDVALAGGRIFCAAGDRVWSLPAAGGTPTLYGAAEVSAGGVAADGARVYWTTATDVRSAPIVGGAVTVHAQGYTELGHLAVDESAIYFADTAGGHVWRLPK